MEYAERWKKNADERKPRTMSRGDVQCAIFSEPKNDRINFPIYSRISISDGLLDFSFKEAEEEWIGEHAESEKTLEPDSN